MTVEFFAASPFLDPLFPVSLKDVYNVQTNVFLGQSICLLLSTRY
jgi:hypothetical protein